jgi:hypothetical protein
MAEMLAANPPPLRPPASMQGMRPATEGLLPRESRGRNDLSDTHKRTPMAELLSRDPAALRPAATTAWMRLTTERVQLDPAVGGSAVRCAVERAVARERRRHGRRVRYD